jgi:large subunit ribosomal protein L15
MPVIEITQHPSNVKTRKRIARGTGGKGGQKAGRGQTGQQSRSGGNIHPRFEGGRTPAVRKWAKLGGFKHHSKITYFAVNLGHFTELEDGTTVDLAFLAAHSMLPKKKRGLHVKLLGGMDETGFSRKLNFQLHAFSNAAKAKVEASGGTCEVIS